MEFQTFDNAYVERLRAGHRETESHFHTYFGELIRLKLRSRVASADAFKDIQQETFSRCLQILRSEKGVQHAERLGALVNSVCNHVLSEHYRAAGRTEALDDDAAERFVAREPDALTRVIAAETHRLVRDVLSSLADRDRRILQALFLDEREKDEICHEIGVTRDYIRVLVHRAKQSFREQYAQRSPSRHFC